MLHKILLVTCTVGIIGFMAFGWEWGITACFHRGANVVDFLGIHGTGLIAGLLGGLLIIEITRED